MASVSTTFLAAPQRTPLGTSVAAAATDRAGDGLWRQNALRAPVQQRKKPYFKASAVAALIGQHPWRSRAAAMLQVLLEDRNLPNDVVAALLSPSIAVALATLNLPDTAELLVPGFAAATADETSSLYATDGSSAAATTVALAANASAIAEVAVVALHSAAAVQAHIETVAAEADVRYAEARRTAATLLRHRDNFLTTAAAFAAEASACMDADAKAVLVAQSAEATAFASNLCDREAIARRNATDAEDAAAVEHSNARMRGAATAVAAKDASALQALSSPGVMRESLRRSAVMKRGLAGEDVALDEFAKRTRTVVTERNAQLLRLDCGKYVLGGRMDGRIADGTVLECKQRDRWWTEVPPYDVIQLRCYLVLTGARHGVLAETHGQGDAARRRETHVTAEDNEWAVIDTALCKVARELTEMDGEGV